MADPFDPSADTFNGCFGCGTDNPIGMKLVFEKEGDAVVCRSRLKRDYAGYRDFVHGGVVATLLDEAMGWALVHASGSYGVTRNLKVDYRRPVTVDRQIVLRGKILEIDGRSVRLASSIEDDRGRLLASAEADWVMVREERATAEPKKES